MERPFSSKKELTKPQIEGRSIILYADTRSRGGAEEHLLTLARNLSQRGWSCEACLPRHTALEELIEEIRDTGSSIRLRNYIDNGKPLLGVYGCRIFLSSLSYFATARPALIHFILPEPDFSRLPVLAAAIVGIPFIMAFHLPLTKIVSPLNRKIYHWLATKHSSWLALSSHNSKALSNIFSLPLERFQIVPNGIDYAKFHLRGRENLEARKKVRAELGLAEDVRVVIGIGRAEERKGFGYFAAAIPRVINKNPDTIFLWAGELPNQENCGLLNSSSFQGLVEILREIEELWHGRSCFRLLGHRKDVPSLLAAADIFVLPSLVEGHPLVLLEAMAAGLPCIATRGLGLSDVIKHEQDGLLVPPRDSKALAESISRLLKEKSMAKSLGRAAAERAKEFDLSVMLEKMESIYEELLR